MEYPEILELTGAYLRVEREGKWLNLDVSDMTPEELEEKFIDREPRELINWMSAIIRKFRELSEVTGIRPYRGEPDDT